LSPLVGSLTQGDIETALGDDLNEENGSSSTSSSSAESQRTVRYTPRLTDAAFMPQGSLSPPPSSPAPSRSGGWSFTSPSIGMSSPQTQQRLTSARPSPKSSPETLQIHFTKPPGSSTLKEGPIEWHALERTLHMDQDLVRDTVQVFQTKLS